MDLTSLLKLPAFALLALGGLCLVLAFAIGFGGRHRGPTGHRGTGLWRIVPFIVLLALALAIGTAGMALRGYRLLDQDIAVLGIKAHAIGPQRWSLDILHPDGHTSTVELAGDDFRVEAVVVKWQTPALLAGLPPLFRLDRLSGRYDDAAREATGDRTVIPLSPHDGWDFLDLRKRYPQWLPGVDTTYGSGAYLPLADGGQYTVSLMRTGALVARTDDAGPPVR
jgi:hypothetical protein